MRGPGSSTSVAPFYVALREAERRILRSALEEFSSVEDAAAALGITGEYIRLRAAHLGGVLEGQPRREPPGPVADARANARSEGVPIKEATWPLRRRGQLIKHRGKPNDEQPSVDGEATSDPPKNRYAHLAKYKAKKDAERDGVDQPDRVLGAEDGEGDSGAGSSDVEGTAPPAEDRSE